MEQAHGLEKFQPLNQITGNHRYTTFQGSFDSQQAFIKVPVDIRLNERLAIEAEGLVKMAELDPGHDHYRVPAVLELGNDYLITEWADGVLMSEDFEAGNTAEIDSHLDYLVQLYAYLDGKSEGGGDVTRFNEPGESSAISRARQLFSELDCQRYFDAELAEQMLHYVETVLPDIETRYTHGDLVPSNVLIHATNTPVIVDCETCSPLWPRHYNIVNLVFNYSEKYPVLSERLAQSFDRYCELLHIEPQDNINAFNASAAMRCVQMTIEKVKDSQRANAPVGPATTHYVESIMQRIVDGRLFVNVA